MIVVATEKEEQNLAAIDPWTAVHFSSGLAMGLTEVPVAVALTAAVAYEGIEQVVERTRTGRAFFNTRYPEKPANAIVDVVVFGVGYALGRMWNRTG